MLKAGVIAVLMFASSAHARMHKVAVIDSGYTGNRAKICAFGNYDLTQGAYGIGSDNITHGTAVADTIASANENYCLVILKVFSGRNAEDNNIIPRAVYRAVYENVDVINMSLEGHFWDKDEYDAIAYAVKHGIKVFVASGNDNLNLDVKCEIFPACYRIPGVGVVGTYELGEIDNIGGVVTDREAWCSEGLCGTSLSTAIATGKYLKGLK